MCLGVPGKVEEVYETEGVKMGRVNFGGIRREVCLEYIIDVAVGEYVIVHVGFAISRLDEEAAQELLRELSEVAAV